MRYRLFLSAFRTCQSRGKKSRPTKVPLITIHLLTWCNIKRTIKIICWMCLLKRLRYTAAKQDFAMLRLIGASMKLDALVRVA